MRETKMEAHDLKVFVYAQQEHNTFGKQLRAIRQSWNMSQRAFGEILGISKQRVSIYENGLRFPRINTIISIADRLKMPLRIVFGEQLSVIQTDGVYRAEILPEEAYKVACAFMDANEKYQRVVKYALEIPLEDEENEIANEVEAIANH